MAKRLKNPIEVTTKIYLDDNGVIEQIEDASVHYGRTCEYGDLGRKGLLLEQNQEVLNIIKDFVEEGVKQAEVKEQIAPKDSLLHIPVP